VRTVETNEAAPGDDLMETELGEVPAEWRENDGVWEATAPASLTIHPRRDAFTLSFSFRATAKTDAELRFGAGRSLSLPDLELPTAAKPETEFTVSPGIWNKIELAYQPATPTSPALLVAAYLNGNLIYYQQELDGAGSAEPASPVELQLSAGELSLTNIRGSDRAGRSSTITSTGEVELNLPLIHYAYYPIEDDPREVTDWGGRTPAKEGFISRFDLNAIRDRGQGYAIRFQSELSIPRAGEYTFSIFSPSSTRLYIDDRLVVDRGGREGDRYAEGSIELSEGTHQLRLDHYQYGGWNRLDVRYRAEDQEFQSLNDMSFKRPVATPQGGERLAVETDDRPYLLRSFLNYPPARVYDYTDKRTHVVNVGEGQGPHYSYDLNRGSILQAWRGGFVDVSDMWVGRGEPQTARPLGTVAVMSGVAQWSEEADSWPDSLAELRHRRYELDEAGRPTFHYTLNDSPVSDRIVPTEAGLRRTLTNSGDETLLTHLAAASRIQELGPGEFELIDPGLRIDIDRLAAGGLRLFRGSGQDRLIAELPPGESITYLMHW
jgi:hypothetical protein